MDAPDDQVRAALETARAAEAVRAKVKERAAAILVAFATWESKISDPMLDVTFFANRRFSAGSAAITLVFFALFGSLFLLTQLLQFVLGYSALSAGVRLLPIALTMMVAAPNSARLVERFGTKFVVSGGMAAKLRAAATALALGARAVRIGGLSMLQDESAGTRILTATTATLEPA